MGYPDDMFNHFPEEYPEEDDGWRLEMRLGIWEVKALLGIAEEYLKVWHGYPRRPRAEQEYLKLLKAKLFGIVTEYNLQKQFPDFQGQFDIDEEEDE